MSDPGRAELARIPLRCRLHTWWPAAIDVLMAGAFVLLIVYSTLDTALRVVSGTALLVWLVALAVGIPLMLRRRWPALVLGVVLASAIIAVLLGMPLVATVLPIAVALYTVTLAGRLRRSILAGTAAVLGVTLAGVLSATMLGSHFVIAPHPDSLDSDLQYSLGFSWFAMAAGCALGYSVRARREHAVQIAEHRTQQAVAEERLRIAREMHDVVAHSMSVIVMKAAVANHVYDTRPEESRAALGVIESVSRAALADIAGVLGSLRSGDETALASGLGLDALPQLVENARVAGVDVELSCGDLPELPAAVQLSAYRIVQEALTNVIKHAAPVRCGIRITAESGELSLVVINDGAPRRPSGKPGHGLIGMRERAALHQGTLQAARRPNGGFAVHARLPYQVRGRHE